MASLFVFSAGGCANKKSKCQKGWNQAVELAKSFGGIVNLAASIVGKKVDIESKMKEAEPKFMDICQQLDDTGVDCVANFKEKILDPTCIMTIAKLPSLR